MATYPDGTLLKASGAEVDRMEGGHRRPIPDPATFTCMGLDWGTIQTIADSVWNLIPQGAAYPSRADGTLLQGSNPQVYVMAGCQRHLIPDPETFTAGGYNWSAVHRITDADLTAIPEGAQLPSVLPPDGTLLKASGAEVDRMEGGRRRLIPDVPTLNCFGGAIQTIADSVWNLIPQGAAYPSRADGTLLQGSGPQVYVMAGCQRHLIPDPETFTAHGYNGGAIHRITDTDLTAIPEGARLPSIHTAGQFYAVNGGGSASDRFLPDQFFSDGGWTASNPASVDTGGVTNPAPQAVYQSEHVGIFTYTIPQLIPVGRYTVRLHFNEFYWSHPRQRIFNVGINDTTVLSDFDIIGQAGGQNKAIVEEFSATATSDGQIIIRFGPARLDAAKVSGIEVIALFPV